MKTEALPQSPLDTPVMFLKGVGERRADVLSKLNIHTVQDIFDFPPRRYLDRSDVRLISQLLPDEEVTVLGEIVSAKVVRYGKRRLVLRIQDGSGFMEALWFHQPDFFSRVFEQGQVIALSGRAKRYKSWQMIHPDFDILAEGKEPLNTGQLIPLYPSGEELKRAGLNNYRLRRIISGGLQRYAGNIKETLPDYLVKRYRLLSRHEAYQQMHFPSSSQMLHQVQRRFKYEELFYLQLLIALRRHFNYSPLSGIMINPEQQAVDKAVAALPFSLTAAQRRVIDEIKEDLTAGHPMNRLLQGDVGSGKTVVALLTMLMVIDAGYQAALMAPTEILAQQHYFNIKQLLGKSAIKVGLLLGSMKARDKKAVQDLIALGKYDIVIGTHALIQDAVSFKKLALVAIDEQHRFGVMQRAGLVEKGEVPHTLVMTATPIPRTLALTIYGDLDVSVIDELPPGRKKINTYWRRQEQTTNVYAFLRQRIEAGEQAYIVYPLVEESEKIDLKAATENFHMLRQEVFPDFKLELLHGRMKLPEKELTMARFKRGESQIMVSTTVIEVGVDVPNASIMIVEHAERFGLSQLHQLRGRVGRGSQQSYCILITPAEITDVGQARMEAMQRTNDGFIIAEEDLKLRGSGDFFGTRQHGLPDLKYANLVADRKIVEIARKDAFELVRLDAHLRAAGNLLVRRQFKKQFVDKFQMANIA